MEIADRRWLGSLALLVVLCGFLLDGYLAHARAAQWCDALISKAITGSSTQSAESYETISGLVAVYAIRPARTTETPGITAASSQDRTARPEASLMFVFEGPVAVKWTCFVRFGGGRIASAQTERGDVSSYGYYIGQQLEWHR